MYLTYNLAVVLRIGSAKSYNYKYKTSITLIKKYLTTIRLMAYVESAITYNLGTTKSLILVDPRLYIIVLKWTHE